MEPSKENSKENINEQQFTISLNQESNVPNAYIEIIEDNDDTSIQNISQESSTFSKEEMGEMNYENSASLVTLKDLKSNSNHNLEVYRSFENKSEMKNNHKLKMTNRKCSRLVKIKTIDFKNQHSKNINKKLESYRCNNKRNSSSIGKMKRNLRTDSVLNTVHPTKRIKRQFAKENIFEPNLTLSQLNNNVTFETKKGKYTPEYSSSSQNFSCQSNKSLGENKDTYDDSLVNSENNSIINNINEKKNTFTTGVVNVVVAQVNNTCILDYNQKKNREDFMLQDSLTSAESFISQLDTVTSASNSEMSNTNSKKDYFTIISSNECSSITLTPPQPNIELTSENDNFVMAKTSSYFKKNNSDSIRTLTPEVIKDKPKATSHDIRSLENQNPKPLLDTIINMKVYPNILENECQNLYLDNCNNVIITDNNFKTKPPNTFENDYNSITRNIIFNNTDKKTYKEDDGDRRNRIYLPDENTIKDILIETEKTQKRSCSEESRNFIPIADLWDKLSTFLDNAIRRLEESMMKKIKNEIKNVLSTFESNMNIKLAEPNTLDEGLQCCLVNNQIIDELTLNLNTEHETVNKLYKDSLQTLHKKIEHVLDIIKPPVTRVSKDTEVGRSVAVSLSDGLRIIHSTRNHCIMHLVSSPIRFLKENFLVIVSVPMFCIVLYLIYSFLVLVMKF